MKFKKIVKSAIAFLKYSRSNDIRTYSSVALNAQLSKCTFEKFVLVAGNASIFNSKIGAFSSIGRYTKITHSQIGRYCAISWDCTINALRHPQSNLTISAFPYVPEVGNFVSKREQSYAEVIIGHDVWIGANTVIMPGVSIGNGAIIGAGAVVTKDVPDFAIVAGVPARLIKYRFDNDVIEALREVQWWDWPECKVRKNIHLFQRPLDSSLLTELSAVSKA
jgi:acetyltransferase-like isoleucine patch superfamily enzyme